LRTSEIQYLFVVCDGAAVFKMEYKMVNQKYFRAPLILVNDWEKLDLKLFAISLSALSFKLRF
jgi:hypothetical protein